MTIKAIETQYKGYRFRSRLEARWAVFFDACGYNWEYEPQGFDLGGGVYYLPDFKLYGMDDNGDENLFWIEVKPAGVAISAEDQKKIDLFSEDCRELCRGYGDFIVLDGPPEEGRVYEGAWVTPASGDKWVMAPIYRGRPSFFDSYEEATNLRGFCGWKGQSPYDRARSARFEHGERPQV